MAFIIPILASSSGQTGDIQYRSVVTGETTAQVGDVITDI